MFRHDPNIKAQLERELTANRAALGGPFTAWITSLKFQSSDNPEEFPFCLNEKEFAFYATKFFSGEIKNIEGIYKPPSFYSALGVSIVKFGFGIIAGAVAISTIPEEAGAAALSAPALATAGGRQTITAVSGFAADKLLPGGLKPEQDRDRRLWPKYLADYHRRLLQ